MSGAFVAVAGMQLRDGGPAPTGKYCGQLLEPTPPARSLATVRTPQAPICADTLPEYWELAGPFANCREPQPGDTHLDCW